MNKNKKFIVVKCGNDNEYNAATEIDKVITKNGFGWFAKYGNPIKFSKLYLDNPDDEIVLCLSIFTNGQYKLYLYSIMEFSETFKGPEGSYPSYYKQNIYYIKTWIKVKKYTGEKINYEDLVVKSSLRKLTNTIRRSTAGHFICQLIK